MKKTLIIGASTNPSRYANIAAKRLLEKGHQIVQIGSRAGDVQGNKILLDRPEIKDIDTVTLYVNPEIQKNYYSYILGLHPKRIIFNPGTENAELLDLASKSNIEVTEACTLVLLSIGQY